MQYFWKFWLQEVIEIKNALLSAQEDQGKKKKKNIYDNHELMGLLSFASQRWNIVSFSSKTFLLDIKTEGSIFVAEILQGPVVQSVVSLTSSLRVISLTVLADSIYIILIFFAEKMWVAFALQKLLTFFQQKISA